MAKSATGSKNWVVGILIMALLATSLLPTVFSNLNTMESDTGANDSNFSAVEVGLISVIGIFIIIGFLYKILKKSGV